MDPSFMYDPIVCLNGQSLGYNVHVSADKNLLLALGLVGMPWHALGHPQVSHYTCLDLDREEKEKYTFESKFDVDIVKRKEAHQEVHVNDSRPKVGIKISSGSYYAFSKSESEKDLEYKTPKTPIRTPTSMKNKKLLEGKEDENSSVRSPLEVIKHVFADKDLSENLSEDLQNTLRAKAANLKEISPACNCAVLGLAGKTTCYFSTSPSSLFYINLSMIL